MQKFMYSYPTRVYFGEGAAADALKQELPRVGRRVMLAFGGVIDCGKEENGCCIRPPPLPPPWPCDAKHPRRALRGHFHSFAVQ